MPEPTFGVWIPVAERLPERSMWVLAFARDDGDWQKAIFFPRAQTWRTNTGHYMDVTHWMPFPPPPVLPKRGEVADAE